MFQHRFSVAVVMISSLLAGCSAQVGEEPGSLLELTGTLIAELERGSEADAGIVADSASAILVSAETAAPQEIDAAFAQLGDWLERIEQRSATRSDVRELLERLASSSTTAEIEYGFWDGCCYGWEVWLYCGTGADYMCDYCVNGNGNCF